MNVKYMSITFPSRRTPPSSSSCENTLMNRLFQVLFAKQKLVKLHTFHCVPSLVLSG